MSLTGETVMPVAPVGYSGGGNNGGGAWGDDGAWIIILFFIFALCGGWGNGWNNGGGGTATQGYDVGASMQRGFDTQSIQGKLDGLTQGMCQQGYQTQQGFHGVDNAVCQLGYQVQNAANGLNTTMLQGFNASNVALMQGQNALATQLADCCCTTQRGQDAINYSIATQSCAIQNAMNGNTRDIIDSQKGGTQAIIDKLCQMEYNGLNDRYQATIAENQALKFQASQTAQNNYLVQSLRPAPIPAYNVPSPYFAPPPAV